MVACGHICSLSAFKTRMWMEKSKKEKSPWVKVKKKSRNLTCLNWQKNLLEFNKDSLILGNLHCWVCWDSAGGFCFSIGVGISSFSECWPNLTCHRSPKGVNCWENFRHKKTYFVLHKCALHKQIKRVWKLNGLPLNLVLRLPRYQPKKNGKLICELCRGFTCVARFDMQLIHLKKHCPFGIDLPFSVYNKI